MKLRIEAQCRWRRRISSRPATSGIRTSLYPKNRAEPEQYRSTQLCDLGRRGFAEIVERNCGQARRFAAGLRDAGYEVLKEVLLNQVLVSFGTPERTERTIAAIQEEGTCWCGGTVWKNRTAMRISVSNWSTTDEDVDKASRRFYALPQDALANLR